MSTPSEISVTPSRVTPIRVSQLLPAPWAHYLCARRGRFCETSRSPCVQPVHTPSEISQFPTVSFAPRSFECPDCFKNGVTEYFCYLIRCFIQNLTASTPFSVITSSARFSSSFRGKTYRLSPSSDSAFSICAFDETSMSDLAAGHSFSSSSHWPLNSQRRSTLRKRLSVNFVTLSGNVGRSSVRFPLPNRLI